MSASKYSEYRAARQVLIDYLLHKVTDEDWHGVSDAANDIRVMEARYQAESKVLYSVEQKCTISTVRTS